VTGNAPGGFSSSIVLTVAPSTGWFDVNYLAPGALYGDPTYDGDRSPGGTLNYAPGALSCVKTSCRRLCLRFSFNNGRLRGGAGSFAARRLDRGGNEAVKSGDDRCAVSIRRARGAAGG